MGCSEIGTGYGSIAFGVELDCVEWRMRSGGGAGVVWMHGVARCSAMQSSDE